MWTTGDLCRAPHPGKLVGKCWVSPPKVRGRNLLRTRYTEHTFPLVFPGLSSHKRVVNAEPYSAETRADGHRRSRVPRCVERAWGPVVSMSSLPCMLRFQEYTRMQETPPKQSRSSPGPGKRSSGSALPRTCRTQTRRSGWVYLTFTSMCVGGIGALQGRKGVQKSPLIAPMGNKHASACGFLEVCGHSPY